MPPGKQASLQGCQPHLHLLEQIGVFCQQTLQMSCQRVRTIPVTRSVKAFNVPDQLILLWSESCDAAQAYGGFQRARGLAAEDVLDLEQPGLLSVL
ncbi:MAG: hypothetical protein RIS79_3868 [Verrucomicrobiota bacterium]